MLDDRYSDVPSPWATDYFSPEHQRGPRVVRPKRAPKPIPDTDILFDVQGDLYKAAQHLRQLSANIGNEGAVEELERSLGGLTRQISNAYKLMNRYLRLHGGESTQNQQGDTIL